MPLTHRLDEIDGPYLNTEEWKKGGARTSTGGGGKKPPKKPPTKTGGKPDKPDKPFDWESDAQARDPMDPDDKMRWK